MTMQLSAFFRASLSTDPFQDVRLADELELQRLYLAIEQTRFADGLKVEYDVPPALNDALVPSLILQPLVENSIKHGLQETGKLTTLTISARRVSDRLVLEVADNGRGPGKGTWDRGGARQCETAADDPVRVPMPLLGGCNGEGRLCRETGNAFAVGVMTPLRVLAVDDEALALRRIEIAVSRVPGVELIGTARGGREGLEMVERLRPDVLLLDINMAGFGGFDVVEGLSAQNAPLVIFCTAFDQYAVRAFQVSAVDYLLKPLEFDRLRAALDKARTTCVCWMRRSGP
jgi:CheY-like chemotaxis protein